LQLLITAASCSSNQQLQPATADYFGHQVVQNCRALTLAHPLPATRYPLPA